MEAVNQIVRTTKYMQPPRSYEVAVCGGCDRAPWCKELKTRTRHCVVWSLEASVLLLFCLGLVVLVEFVVVHPRPPQCDIVSLSLTQFSASTDAGLRLTHHNNDNHDAKLQTDPIQKLTAVIVITLRARNQIQRIGTFYDHVHVMVLYNGDALGEGWVGPFFQGRSNTNILHTQVEAHKLPVGRDTGTQLLADINDHIVELQVNVHVLTRVRILKYITHHFKVQINCDVTVTMSAIDVNSTLLSKRCKSKD